jgi:hypothetical protein
MRAVNVPGIIADAGSAVKGAWKTYGLQSGLPVKVGEGYPCLARFEFTGEYADELKNLYTVNMLNRGFLAGTDFYPTLAHTPEIVASYGQAIGEVFAELASMLERRRQE